MSTYDLTPGAQIDLQEIGDWISQDSPARAITFVEELKILFQRLADRPLIGRSRPEIQEGLRSFHHRAYLIFYTPTPDGIAIFRIIHGRRDLTRIFDS